MPDRELEMERRAATSAVGKLPKLLKEHATALQENTETMRQNIEAVKEDTEAKNQLTDAINKHLNLEAVRKSFRL